VICFTGKSLDACAELREKKKLKEPFKKKNRKKVSLQQANMPHKQVTHYSVVKPANIDGTGQNRLKL